jgi:thiamine-monophosphate kinase
MSSEFSLIERFTRAFPQAQVEVGIGDDCAVLAPSRGSLCLTTDTLVEGVHFTRAAFLAEDVGHKALAVNLSDLASMGAVPKGFLCALTLPPWLDERYLAGVAKGMAALSRRTGAQLLGGNLSRGQELSLTLTALGEVPPGKALTRTGACPGDRLYVSGTLGDARLGLSMLPGRRARAKLARSGAVRRQLRPEPRLKLGLLARRFAAAAIDLSDGLVQDLGHLCRASKVGARLRAGDLPLSAELRRAHGSAAYLWALRGGEDYELLLAIGGRRVSSFERACASAHQKVTCIGEVVAAPGVQILGASGARLPNRDLKGFDHFVPPRGLGRSASGRLRSASKEAHQIDPQRAAE